MTAASALLTRKPALHLLDHCVVEEQVRTAQREGCVAPLVKPWLRSRPARAPRPVAGNAVAPETARETSAFLLAFIQRRHLSQSPEPGAISGVFGCIRECVNYGNNTTNMA